MGKIGVSESCVSLPLFSRELTAGNLDCFYNLKLGNKIKRVYAILKVINEI